MIGGGFASFVLLCLFGRTVVTGAVGHQRDTGAFYYPLTEWFARELAAGRFPLWCPLIFAGYPIVADGEIGMLYPPNLVALLLLPADVAFIAVRSGHYLLAAIGGYALGRMLGVSRLGSAFGGVTFALGGFMIGHLDHGNIIRSASWLPLTLCTAEMALRSSGIRPRAFWIALGAATVALAGLGSHPQIVLIGLVALGTYVGARALATTSWRPGIGATLAHAVRRLGVGAGIVVVMSVLGLAGAAIQLIPLYELGQESSRGGGLTYAQAAAGGVHPVDLLTLMLPYGFRADPAVQWMRYPYWESTIYVGIVGLFLAAIGLGARRLRVTLPLAVLGMVGLLLAMAHHAPVDVYAWLWTLPGFSSMRAPVRYTLIVELALALLAAVGLDQLRSGVASRGARLVAVTICGLGAVGVGAAIALRSWVAANEIDSLRIIAETYLALPHDRSSLTAAAVRSGVLATLDLGNPWTLLALATGLSLAALVAMWAWRGRGSRRLAALVASLGILEVLLVAHGFHPTTDRDAMRAASRPLRYLSEQPGTGRTLLAGTADTAITSRPALVGVAQAYGYSSLPTARMERYWTRVNEVGDTLLDLWSVRFVVEPKPAPGGGVTAGVIGDPAHPLLDGPAGSPLGEATFRIGATPADTLRLIGSLSRSAVLTNGEPIAEIVVSGGGEPPVRLDVRAGDHVSESAYDELVPRPAHTKAPLGLVWTPRDQAGTVYHREISLADLGLPASRVVEQVQVRTTMREGSFRLIGLGLLDSQTQRIGSVLPTHRSDYRVVYEDDTTVIRENRAAFPRAFLASRAVGVPVDDWAITNLTELPIDPRTTVMIERPTDGPPAPVALLDGPPVGDDERAEIVRSTPNGIAVQVRATTARYLVLTDSAFPGWRATVDGVDVPVERANYLFRAVLVPPGDHLVAWRYAPVSLSVGVAVSGLAVTVMVGLVLFGMHRRSVPVAALRRALDGGGRTPKVGTGLAAEAR